MQNKSIIKCPPKAIFHSNISIIYTCTQLKSQCSNHFKHQNANSPKQHSCRKGNKTINIKIRCAHKRFIWTISGVYFWAFLEAANGKSNLIKSNLLYKSNDAMNHKFRSNRLFMSSRKNYFVHNGEWQAE